MFIQSVRWTPGNYDAFTCRSSSWKFGENDVGGWRQTMQAQWGFLSSGGMGHLTNGKELRHSRRTSDGMRTTLAHTACGGPTEFEQSTLRVFRLTQMSQRYEVKRDEITSFGLRFSPLDHR